MAEAALKTIFPDRVLPPPRRLGGDAGLRLHGQPRSRACMGIAADDRVSEWVQRQAHRSRSSGTKRSCLFVYSLTNVAWSPVEFAPPTAHALRARLLRQAIDPLLDLAIAGMRRAD